MAAPAAGLNGIKNTAVSTGSTFTPTGAQVVNGMWISSNAGATSITFPTGNAINTAAAAAGYSTANYTWFVVTLVIENTTPGNTYTFTGNTGILEVGFDFATPYAGPSKRFAFNMKIIRVDANTVFVVMDRTIN